MENKTNEIIQMINHYYILTGAPIVLVNSSFDVVHFMPDTDHHYIPIRFLKFYIEQYEKSNIPPQIPLLITREHGALIGVIKISSDEYIIIGPIAHRRYTLEELTNVYSEFMSADEVLQVYRINLVTSPSAPIRFINILISLNFFFCQKHVSAQEIIEHALGTFADSPEISFSSTEIDPTPDHIMLENFFIFKNKLMSAIRSGNIDELNRIWSYPYELDSHNFMLSKNREKTVVIPCLSFIADAAIEGGAVPLKVISSYTACISRLDKLHAPSELMSLILSASYDNCRLVREASGRELMPEICRECERYINEHIAEKITVNDLTAICGVSKRKLYTVFEANFGTTINDFIQRERLRRAKQMLNLRGFTMAEISRSLGYTNQSYFISVFEKYYGCTPGEYVSGKKKIAEI